MLTRKFILIVLLLLPSACLPMVVNESPEAKIRESNSKLIEEALKMELREADIGENDEANKIVDESFEAVNEGNYKKALAVIMDGIKSFPKDFSVQVWLATQIGDYSSHFEDELKERMIQKSKAIFEKLFREASQQEKRTYYWFMNEHYFRFRQYKNQYELGLEKVEFGLQSTENRDRRISSGYYSQGVGAAHYAKELLLNGNKKLALEYAQKAVIAWGQYFSYTNTYYNAYVHFAIALAILGNKEEALRALSHASEIIKKDHVEFQEVKDFITKAEQLGLI